MSLINKLLGTGREILDAEKRLDGMPTSHPDRKSLSDRHAKLMRKQQDEIVAASKVADWDTVRFALTLHGQGADRPDPGQPTPAEMLSGMMRQYGAENVVTALDQMRKR